jgi:hypothetical protein
MWTHTEPTLSMGGVNQGFLSPAMRSVADGPLSHEGNMPSIVTTLTRPISALPDFDRQRAVAIIIPG